MRKGVKDESARKRYDVAAFKWVERGCAYAKCGKIFKPTGQAWNKYCSPICRTRAAHERAELPTAKRLARKLGFSIKPNAEIIEAEQKLEQLQRQFHNQELVVEQLKARQIGRPLTREQDAARYGPRIAELRATTPPTSWGKIQVVVEREMGLSRSLSGLRHLHEAYSRGSEQKAE